MSYRWGSAFQLLCSICNQLFHFRIPTLEMPVEIQHNKRWCKLPECLQGFRAQFSVAGLHELDILERSENRTLADTYASDGREILAVR